MHAEITIERVDLWSSSSSSSSPINSATPTTTALDDSLKERIWKMYDENMGDISRGTSLHMRPDEKRQELFDPSTIYFLAYTGGGDAAAANDDEDEHRRRQRTLAGFASCRLDEEDTIESLEGKKKGGEKRKVVYLYELQVSSQRRNQGIGHGLLERVEGLCFGGGKEEGREGGGEQEVMLTCLKCNTAALRFYARQGYQPDDIDPTRYAAVSARQKLLNRLRRSRQQQSKSKSGSGGGRNRGKAAAPSEMVGKAEDSVMVDLDWMNGEEEKGDGGGDDSAVDYRILSKRIVGASQGV